MSYFVNLCRACQVVDDNSKPAQLFQLSRHLWNIDRSQFIIEDFSLASSDICENLFVIPFTHQFWDLNEFVLVIKEDGVYHLD